MGGPTRGVPTLACLFVYYFSTTLGEELTGVIEVAVSRDIWKSPVTGRALVYFAKNVDQGDPISQCGDDQTTSQVFGKDAHGLQKDQNLLVTGDTLGYPIEALPDIPHGTYYVQAQILEYTSYKRSVDTQPVLLRKSCVNPGGSDGSYGAPVGTLYSKVQKIQWTGIETVHIEITEEEMPTPSPGCVGDGRENSDFIKTVRYTSPSLSAFWGQDITLEACVLLPWGWGEHPDAKYPTIVAHGHYSAQWWTGGYFSETPPAANITGYDRIQAEAAYELYKSWVDPNGVFKDARTLVVQINHANPFFDDSYAVDSENLGPYGDAITYEFLPYIEKMYRGISQGWARGLFGGSTGGWESIGVQVLYPDDYNGCHAACPDPITFSSYTTIDLYKDTNAYFYDAPFKRTERPGQRDHYSGQTIGFGHPYGQTTATVREMNLHELVLGNRSRSCGQWDIWEAVFGPRGADGYPERIYDKRTGSINATTAQFWKENFDLKYILQRDSLKLMPKLQGKIHIYVGGSDTFFLTNAVMDMEDYLSGEGSGYNATVCIVHGTEYIIIPKIRSKVQQYLSNALYRGDTFLVPWTAVEDMFTAAKHPHSRLKTPIAFLIAYMNHLCCCNKSVQKHNLRLMHPVGFDWNTRRKRLRALLQWLRRNTRCLRVMLRSSCGRTPLKNI
eukprot:m.572767 g.572767  ORF g.572767 m.572767 type:complete len:671 (+) comp22274_c0_seq9:118-2130(+)